MTLSTDTVSPYYVPARSIWPLFGSIALFFMALGGGYFLNGSSTGGMIFLLGLVGLLVMMVGWFGSVIHESLSGLYSPQVERSFRWGMGWFIFSEVMFFAAFFGALFYARMFSVPWLGGEGHGAETHHHLWAHFDAIWPLLHTPGTAHGITKEAFDIPSAVIPAFGIPALNTALLLSSGYTITMAHHALLHGKRTALVQWLSATIALGLIFLGFQIYEYGHAFLHLNLTLSSGIYGSTFFMLTGFHGFHVTIGVIMLIVMLIRILQGHFTPQKHFAFEAVAWYWHFVDVVWLGLFIFVYIF